MNPLKNLLDSRIELGPSPGRDLSKANSEGSTFPGYLQTVGSSIPVTRESRIAGNYFEISVKGDAQTGIRLTGLLERGVSTECNTEDA